MKPLKLTIQIDAYDCCIYGGYVFFIMQDGKILYGSYPHIISCIARKYQEFSGLIKIAFLRNDYYHSNVAKTFMNIPNIKECIYREWDLISSKQEFLLEFDEISEILSTLCILPSIPLDTKIYGMRLFVGCTDGMYEVRLCPDSNSLNPKKIEKCFDGKVINLNAKYGKIVMSLGHDGIASESIDVEGDEITKVNDKNVLVQQHSNRTFWADADIMNYSTPSEFSYFKNTVEERKRAGQKKFWEKYETKQIVNFATREYSMDEMIAKSRLKKEDISASFNSKEKCFIQLKDGSIVSYNFKEEEDRNEVYPIFSTKRISLVPAENTKGFGRILSGTIIPKGCAVEYFDKVVLLQNSTMQVIENNEVMKVRSFMNSYRFQDLLSVTKQNSITLHALDTLNISKDIRQNNRNAYKSSKDMYDNVPDMPDFFNNDKSGENDLPL